MKAYGRNLRWIEDRQYGDEMHTGIPLPSSGKKRGGSGENGTNGLSRRWSGSIPKMRSGRSLAGISPP